MLINDEITLARTKLVLELLELTNATAMGEHILGHIKQMFDEEGEDLSFFEQANFDSLTEKMIPLYAKHFDDETLHALIAFYKTPVGRKLVTSMPEITIASMEVGREWAEELMEGHENYVH